MSNRGRHRKVLKIYHVSRYSTSWISKVLDDETISRILDHQFKQCGIRDLTIFEKDCNAGKSQRGFTWAYTIEGHAYWLKIMTQIRNSEYYKK